MKMRTGPVIIVALLGFFLIAALANLRSALVHPDEVAYAMPYISFLRHSGSIPFCEVTIPLGMIALPVNNMCSYNFALPSYLMAPFLLCFGFSFWTMKLVPILLSGLALVFVFHVFAALFDRKAAFLTALLLATSTLFVHYSRAGLIVAEVMINALFLGGVYFGIRYARSKEVISLCYAALLLGMTLSVKISAATRFAAFLAALLLVYPGQVRAAVHSLGLRRMLLAVVFFAAGAFLFIYFNAARNLETLRLVSHLFRPVQTYTGDNNTRVAAHLKERLGHLNALVAERVPQYPGIADQGYATLKPYEWFLLCVFYGMLVFNPVFYFRHPAYAAEGRKTAFVYAVFSVLFLLSVFSPGSWREHQLSSLFPLPQLITALGIRNLYRLAGPAGGRAPRVAALGILACLFVVNLHSLARYHLRHVQTARERGDAAYPYRELRAFLDRTGSASSFFLDWHTPVMMTFLYGGDYAQVEGTALFDDAARDRFTRNMDRILRAGPAQFVGYDDNEETRIKTGWLKAYARERGKAVLVSKAAVGPGGKTFCSAYRLADIPAGTREGAR